MNTTNKRGMEVLHDASLNKSTGFTEVERQALGLVGLIPDITESIETQLSRVLLQLEHKKSDLDRFIYLMNLLDTNQTLFYRTLMSDPARSLEPKREARVPAGGRLHVDKRQGGLRRGRAVPALPPRRVDVPALAGKQLVYLPGCGHGQN